jgi:murein DD-endopeptidase MepM/ murein hydrolase activator NlpD
MREFMSNRFNEPVPDHLADTGPSRAIRDADLLPAWRRSAGLLSLIGAVILTIATTLVLLLPNDTAPTPIVPTATTQLSATLPAATLPPQATSAPGETVPAAVLPTLSVDEAAALLAAPVTRLDTEAETDRIQVVRDFYNPFTIIPDRPRSEVIQYTVETGDTIFRIAERFGLKPESIAWANDRSLLGGLRPGRVINILPIDGAYWTVNEPETIASIASRFKVDPYAIIDSEFNDLFGMTPETVLPSNSRVVVPGGQAEQIVWNPVVERTEGDASSGSVARISFAAGEPGSCGLVDNPGGGGGWIRPVATGSYQWSQGYSSYHTGVDLAGAVGTPIYAANGGTVIFAGWNSFGYGYAIVLAHGPYTTVYGHLSAINVGCGQSIGAGQVIGAMGSSGQSSGPHLHFEIRYNDIPQDPTYTLSF